MRFPIFKAFHVNNALKPGWFWRTCGHIVQLSQIEKGYSILICSGNLWSCSPLCSVVRR